jgi:hypothetical protein
MSLPLTVALLAMARSVVPLGVAVDMAVGVTDGVLVGVRV